MRLTQVLAIESVSTPVAAPAKSSNGSAKKTHMEPIATSCEIEKKVPSIQVDLVPFEGLPALNSVEWQLQYPPGGSTHPSYPFPTPDPRLIFHESLVPVNDGLPDCARVAPLVLPFGWRQVSWCGLLPIVFDPYQQAFKLTPAGPLPLVHEELLQNGLAKYVPGGELHPETGMLPDMTLWSDGSEGVVYDWPGVSWTLPWADQGHFDFLDKTHISSGATNDGVQTDDQTLVSLSVTWREERDCPNQVFDLHDGWRWMADKEQRPNEDFVPDNTKRWYRSGALRCVRKFKSPIPELMMLAMMEDQEVSNPVLHNQDARIPQKNNFFCPFKSVSTPVNVDMTVLADTEFTLVELLSYFPQHFNWGAAAERLHRAGIQPSMIRDAIYMTRGLSDDVNGLSTSSISAACYAAKRRDLEQGLHHEAKEEEADDHDDDENTQICNSFGPVAPKSTTTTSYTSSSWTYQHSSPKINYPLLALTHGLLSLPNGPDAGPLTHLIQHCRLHQRYNVLLSEVAAVLKEVGIKPVIEAGERGCADEEVVGRYRREWREARKRRMKEDGGGGKRRKVG